MQHTAPHADDEAAATATIHPGQPQNTTHTATGTTAAFQLSKTAPNSVTRSETGASLDLSAASNVAAQGEEPMDFTNTSGGVRRAGPMMRNSDAEKWFQDSNKNASTRGNVSFTDDDPPFHLPQRPSNELLARHLPVRPASGTPGLHPPSLLPMQSFVSSSSGEFRSVIDDLTVENKRLRRKLKLYERSHAAHLHPDRMFEVRMPGLVGKDKQRLERILKDFADSILGSDIGGHYARSIPKKSKGRSNNASSSSTLHSHSKTSNQVDSAYASGSGSGNTSGSRSQQDKPTFTSELSGRSRESRSKDQRVHSYLQTVGHGLLPQRTTAMTDKARKREVVKRLEWFFTGRASTNPKNEQSAQQQEVSTAAANADKRASEARGRPVQDEGSREAHILPAEDEAAMLRADNTRSKSKHNSSPAYVPNQETEQRPTRPLDLDLNRAQNAAENLAYIRHLGFKTQPANDENNGDVANEDYTDKNGWIYLNLMISMAQLHTVNVTPDYVRQSIKEVSDRLEVSPDGSRIRWKGGSEGTRMSGESGSSAESKNSTPGEGMEALRISMQSPSRSRSDRHTASDQMNNGAKTGGLADNSSGTKTSSRDANTTGEHIPGAGRWPRKRPIFLGHIGREETFQYQPKFLHGAVSDEENDYYLDENDSLLSSGLREDITGSGDSGQRSRKTNAAGSGRDDGPMIFYHCARFVTDLSGDHGFTPVNNTIYFKTIQVPIGCTTPSDESPDFESKGLISTGSPNDFSTQAYFPDAQEGTLNVYAGSAPKPSALHSKDPIPLPVCGIGGITPAENLVFYTKHRQVVRQRHPAVIAGQCRASNILRSKLFGVDKALLQRIPTQDKLDVKLEGFGAVRHTELDPSELPPPSYAYMAVSSSNDDEYDSDEESNGDDEWERGESNLIPDFVPPAPMRSFEETAGADESASESNDDLDDDSDDEVDMLAHERQLNAELVAEREREWDEGNFEPSPDAHSSAATVGDRSFLSDEEDAHSQAARSDKGRKIHSGGIKRGVEEMSGQVPLGSPAKRQETPRSRAGRN